MHDPVEKPEGYNSSTIEAVDAATAMAYGWEAHFQQHTREGFGMMEGHCLLTAFKYIWRAPIKGDWRENVRKAIWYLRKAIGDDPRMDRQQ